MQTCPRPRRCVQVLTVPHFDFHLYMITNAERVGIVVGDPQLDVKMARQPAAEFVPAGYAVDMSSAGMGLHWNGANAPEQKGKPLTATFIYGSYDGAFIFAGTDDSKGLFGNETARRDDGRHAAPTVRRAWLSADLIHNGIRRHHEGVPDRDSRPSGAINGDDDANFII
jgi:hypothetical protein